MDFHSRTRRPRGMGVGGGFLFSPRENIVFSVIANRIVVLYMYCIVLLIVTNEHKTMIKLLNNFQINTINELKPQRTTDYYNVLHLCDISLSITFAKSSTRGNRLKLVKHSCRCDVRKYFLVAELWTFGIVFLILV